MCEFISRIATDFPQIGHAANRECDLLGAVEAAASELRIKNLCIQKLWRRTTVHKLVPNVWVRRTGLLEQPFTIRSNLRTNASSNRSQSGRKKLSNRSQSGRKKLSKNSCWVTPPVFRQKNRYYIVQEAS